MRGTQKVPGFRAPIRAPVPLGPEHTPWYWHPGRLSVRSAPPDFVRALHALDPDLEATWNPITERWQVWIAKPSFQHPICQRWMLLFIVKGPSGEYQPLDERVFARLYHASARQWGSGREYFRRVEAELARDRERIARQQTQDAVDLAMPAFEHSQIAVSMAGPSNGSKFSTYHA